MGFWDVLFPKYCVSCKKIGGYLCENCFATISFSYKTMCLLCGKGAVDGITHPHCQKAWGIDGCFIMYEYKAAIKKLLYVLKYKPYVTEVIPLLADLFYEGLIQHERVMTLLQQNYVCLSAIPLHSKKLKQRGYNHAQLLANAVGKKLGVPVIDTLDRIKETHIQAGLSKQQRADNMKGAFSLKKGVYMKGKTLLVIDDIVTTGVTFVEAGKILKKGGADAVYGIAFSGEN